MTMYTLGNVGNLANVSLRATLTTSVGVLEMSRPVAIDRALVICCAASLR